MKKITLFTILLFTIFSCSSISPSNLNYFSKKTGGNVQNTREQMDGIASWYGPNFLPTSLFRKLAGFLGMGNTDLFFYF